MKYINIYKNLFKNDISVLHINFGFILYLYLFIDMYIHFISIKKLHKIK